MRKAITGASRRSYSVSFLSSNLEELKEKTSKVLSHTDILWFLIFFFPGHCKSHFLLVPWSPLWSPSYIAMNTPTSTCRLKITSGPGILLTKLPRCSPSVRTRGLPDFLPCPNSSGLEFISSHSTHDVEVRPYYRSIIRTTFN